MKKMIVCLIGAIILSNCEISPRKAHAEEDWAIEINRVQSFRRVEYVIKDIDGMRYIVASNDANYSSPFFVNLTLEKLQVEKAKLEIQLLNKQLSNHE